MSNNAKKVDECDAALMATLRDAVDETRDEAATLLIEPDNPAWVFIARFGEYIRERPNTTPNYFDARLRGFSKAGKLELGLSPGTHRLKWENVEMVIEMGCYVSASGDGGAAPREFAKLHLPPGGVAVLESFLKHARRFAREKTGEDANNVVSRVFKQGGWRQTSSFPKRAPESLVLPDDAVGALLADMRDFRDSEDAYAHFGFAFKRNYLVVGPPGSGKSSLVVVAASEMDLDICYLTVTTDMSERDICAAVSSLNDRAMLVIEDVEVLCGAAATGHAGACAALAALTNVLDGSLHRHGLMTILTSANPHLLEEALVRHGRVDHSTRLRELGRAQVALMVERMLRCDGEDAAAVAARVWAVAGSLGLTSTSVAHFLFRHRKLEPAAFTAELCAELTQGTHTEHVSDARRRAGGGLFT